MLNQAEITNTIKSIPWFFDLSSESVQRLSLIAKIFEFPEGEEIFAEGEQHPNLYIILDGKIGLESIVPGHGPLLISTTESLDVIGWSSLTPVVRQNTCSAFVIEPARVLMFNADSLMSLCEEDCDLGFTIMRRLANIVASRLLTHRLQLLELLTFKNN